MTNPDPTPQKKEEGQPSIDAVTTIFLFIDSFGVVIARLLVVFILAGVLSSPVLLAAWIAAQYLNEGSAYFAGYMFAAYIALVFFSFGIKFDAMSDLTFSKQKGLFGNIRIAIDAITFVLILPFVLIIAFIPVNIFARRYLDEPYFKAMMCYILSILAFMLGVYFLAQDGFYGPIFFLPTHYPQSLGDAIYFTVDVAIRGFFFDILDHFSIHITQVEQSANVVGKTMTFILRCSSLILAISLVLQMVYATRDKLKKLEE